MIPAGSATHNGRAKQFMEFELSIMEGKCSVSAGNLVTQRVVLTKVQMAALAVGRKTDSGSELHHGS